MNAVKGMHWDSKEDALNGLQRSMAKLRTLWSQKQYNEAEALSDKVLEACELLEKKNWKALILFRKAEAAPVEDGGLCETLMEEALEVAEEADADNPNFPTLMSMFNSSLVHQRVSLLLPTWERIRRLLDEEERVTAVQVESLRKIATGLAHCRVAREAAVAGSLGLERCRMLRAPGPGTLARMLRNVGWREVDLGNFQKGLECAEEALAITPLGDKPSRGTITSRGDSLVLRAGVYEEMCLFSEADKCYREALRTIRLTRDSSEEAPCLNNHGVLLLILGRPEEAEHAFLESMRLKGGKLGLNSYAMFNMPEVHHLQGKNELALKEIREVLALWQDGEGLPLPRTQMVLGDILSAMGQFKEAEEAYNFAIHIADLMGSDKELGTILVGQGRNMARQGRYSDASKELRSAVHLFDRVLGKSHPRLGVGLTVLAKVSCMLGHTEDGRAFADRAVRMCEEVFGKEHKEAVAARQAWTLVTESVGAEDQAITF